MRYVVIERRLVCFNNIMRCVTKTAYVSIVCVCNVW